MTKTQGNGRIIRLLIGRYRDLYKERFGISPVVNNAQCSKLIVNLLKEHSPQGISGVIELYFQDDTNSNFFHLPAMLSAYSMNKYLPRLRLDPRIYSNAEEHNKLIY